MFFPYGAYQAWSGRWGGNLTNFSSNFEPSIACLKIARIIFFAQKFVPEQIRFWQICAAIFAEQIFEQIFASHEPSFGPYKFVEK